MKVWIVEGEHHYVPGIVVKVCVSKQIADREAAELVQIILNDLVRSEDEREVVTAENWEEKLAAALVTYIEHYNEEPRVEISEHEVIGS